MQVKRTIKTARRSDAGFQPDLSKRRKWYSESDESDAQEDNTDDQNTISLSRASFNKRLERAKKAGVNDFVISLGYDDADTLRSALDATSQIGELQSTITALETQLAEQTQQLDDVDQQQRQTMLVNLATSAGAVKVGGHWNVAYLIFKFGDQIATTRVEIAHTLLYIVSVSIIVYDMSYMSM